MLVVIAGTIPRNLLFAANLRYFASVPWAVPLTAVYLWFFWRYLNGAGPPESTAEERRASLRANRVVGPVWAWALLSGGLGIVALVLALRVANRLVVLPQQQLPDLSQVPQITVLALLLMAAPVAGIVEEAAFRGYMQGPDRTAPRVGRRHSGHRDDVCHRSPGLHVDPLAVLPGRGRDLRHRDVPDRVDSARRGIAHGWEPLFESRSVAARSGGMAGRLGPHRADLANRRRRVLPEFEPRTPHRGGWNGLGILPTRTRCSEIAAKVALALSTVWWPVTRRLRLRIGASGQIASLGQVGELS